MVKFESHLCSFRYIGTFIRGSGRNRAFSSEFIPEGLGSIFITLRVKETALHFTLVVLNGNCNFQSLHSFLLVSLFSLPEVKSISEIKKENITLIQ